MEEYRKNLLKNIELFKSLVMDSDTFDELEELDNLIDWHEVKHIARKHPC